MGIYACSGSKPNAVISVSNLKGKSHTVADNVIEYTLTTLQPVLEAPPSTADCLNSAPMTNGYTTFILKSSTLSGLLFHRRSYSTGFTRGYSYSTLSGLG